jgi:uncharacterized protein YjiS (DUF1127 family)
VFWNTCTGILSALTRPHRARFHLLKMLHFLKFKNFSELNWHLKTRGRTKLACLELIKTIESLVSVEVSVECLKMAFLYDRIMPTISLIDITSNEMYKKYVNDAVLIQTVHITCILYYDMFYSIGNVFLL